MKNWLSELHRRSPVLAFTGWLNFVLFGIFAVLSLVDDTQILGINRWYKPMKFALSIGIYTWTIGWLLGSLDYLRSRWIASGISLTMIVEIACIGYQAARGMRSHFNTATPLDAAIFNLMGIMIFLNTILAAFLLLLFLKPRARISPGYLAGIRIGLVVFLLASGVGGIMIQTGAHAVGVPDGGPGIPFVNWSTEGGDLRAAHFLGLHALQILPFMAFLMERSLTRPLRWIYSAGFVYAVVTSIVFLIAWNGIPLYLVR